MIGVLSRNWWALVVRGIVAVIFGLCAIILPGLTVTALVLLFGAYVLVDGVFMIVAAFAGGERTRHRWLLLFEGIVSIIAGILTFAWPGITTLVLLYFIAAWAIITGVAEVMAAVRLRREIANEWLLGLAGIASILFGVFAFIYPRSGALSLIWIIGIYALIFGILLILLGLRLHNSGGRTAGGMRGAF
jgi:uncharacterized membrane protein HdeD (DUF308 family)